MMSSSTTAATMILAVMLAGLPAGASTPPVEPPPALEQPRGDALPPPALDAFLAILGQLPEQGGREPAWRNPHAAPRPSPDREFEIR